MGTLNPKQVAVSLGLLAAAMHLIWSVMVALGFGQAWINWIIGLHFVSATVTVMPFNAVTAIILLVVTFVLGSIVGFVFATAWNWTGKKL
ncbi:MAG TPA: hypothetical protein VJH90_02245 [archaeon]|nr:hypothetical protein [archaeon]